MLTKCVAICFKKFCFEKKPDPFIYKIIMFGPDQSCIYVGWKREPIIVAHPQYLIISMNRRFISINSMNAILWKELNLQARGHRRNGVKIYFLWSSNCRFWQINWFYTLYCLEEEKNSFQPCVSYQPYPPHGSQKSLYAKTLGCQFGFHNLSSASHAEYQWLFSRQH